MMSSSARHALTCFLIACDWFKNLLFSTNSLAKLLSDSLLLDSLLSDSLISLSHSKLLFKSTNHIQSCNYVCLRARLLLCFCHSRPQSSSLLCMTDGEPVTLECLRLLCQYFSANFPLFRNLILFLFLGNCNFLINW